MNDFREKVVIVTGASEGIGRAFCLALAPMGARLALAARNEERLRELKREVEEKGGEAIVVPTDVTDESACRALVERTVEEWGRLDVLVNNAGQTMWTRMDEMKDVSIYERLMRLNYLGSVYCTFHALEHLKKTRGRIVAVSSIAGYMAVPCRTAYSATKHAMAGFFDSLRVELREFGVSVTIVAPDFVVSHIHDRALDGQGNELGKSPMAGEGIMTAERCAEMMAQAVAKRKRLLITTPRARLGRLLRVLAPALAEDLAAREIAKGTRRLKED